MGEYKSGELQGGEAASLHRGGVWRGFSEVTLSWLSLDV